MDSSKNLSRTNPLHKIRWVYFKIGDVLYILLDYETNAGSLKIALWYMYNNFCIRLILKI
jgi:hypothetical protein